MKQFHSELKRFETAFKFSSIRFFLILAVFFLNSEKGRGQVSITTTGAAYSENFNAIGSSASATLPSGFVFLTGSNTFASGNTVTTLAYGTSGTGIVSTTGGRINWANGVTASSTDRAIGFLNTGSFATPDTICFAFTNNTGSTVTSIDLSWNYEKYRSGTRQFDWTFFHGSSLSSMTAFTSGDLSGSADANNTTVYNPPTQSAKAITINGVSISSGSTYYIKWVLTGSGGSTNGQGFGVDDVSITLNASAGAPVINSPTSANILTTSADLGGNVTGDGGSSITERGIVWSVTATNSDPLIGGSGVTMVTTTGTTGVFAVNATGLPSSSGISFKAYATNSVGTSYTSVSTFNTLGATPPTLTAATGATVDASFDVTYTDDAAWRTAITAVKYGANTLVLNTDYTISAGTITLIPSGSSGSGLRTAGSQTVTVVATGYNDATVTQTIAAGVPAALVVSVQPVGPGTNGSTFATQPVVLLKDQYNNTSSSTASVTASVGSGTWTLGGTTSISAVAGSASFSNLTASAAATTLGATISFSSAGLPSVSSASFNIPGPTLAKWTFDAITVSGSAGVSPVLTAGDNSADLGSNVAGSEFKVVHANAASTWSTPSGNGSSKSILGTNWGSGDYFQFRVNTNGYSGIQLQWDQTGSNTGPRDFKVQYSVDGINFTDASGTNSSYSLTNDSWSISSVNSVSNRILDLSAVSSINGQDSVYFRLVCNSSTSISGGAIGTGGTGRVDNFQVIGSPCSTPYVLAGTSGGAQVCETKSVGYGANYLNAGGCEMIARLIPSGATPVSGSVTTCVKVESSTPFNTTQPFLVRHWDIEPVAGSTATIKLYFTSAEASTYNANHGPGYGNLPVNDGDIVSMVKVYKFAGTHTGPGLFDYSPGTMSTISPSSVTWNTSANAWEVTFDVTSFSGFFIGTPYIGAGGLPVSLISFSAKRTSTGNLLKWSTASEQNNTGFEILRSEDGVNYSRIGFAGSLAANGNSNTLLQYSFVDNTFSADKQYYQLKQIDIDGQTKLSSVVLVRSSLVSSITVERVIPNPVKETVRLIVGSPVDDQLQIGIYDISGRLLLQQTSIVSSGFNTLPIEAGRLSSGTYLIRIRSIRSGEQVSARMIKE